ncbi:DUF5677 domain-containing protein [Psychrilyobacter atlanticus]|uniref:DUF5677 domain-containing protein n=1 Tax=Psychrilyobacter atlanticus TaxID=271091 RepID=UPI0003FFF7FB|nr:DUF5677 domain-containing protein [Psychrilyobacter atlanticus]
MELDCFQEKTELINEMSKEFVSIIDELFRDFYKVFKEINKIKIIGVTENLTLMLSREALEKIDGIKILGSYASADNINILMRCLIELTCEILFILKKNSEKRAMSYLYFKQEDFLKYKKKALDELDKEFNKEYKDLETFKESIEDKSAKEKQQKKLKEARINYTVMVEDLKSFKEKIKDELVKVNKKKKGRVKWYDLYNDNSNSYRGLFNGPFKIYSMSVHGQTSIIHNRMNESGILELRSLRYPKDIELALEGVFTAVNELIKAIEEKLLKKDTTYLKEWAKEKDIKIKNFKKKYENKFK